MPARLRAIVPKRLITSADIQTRVNEWYKQVARDFKTEMQVYPPKRNSGGYKRTFKYRRGWNTPPVITPNSVTVINPVPYSRVVGGPRRGEPGRRQSARMAGLGWRSTTDVIPFVVAKNRGQLQDIVLPYRSGVTLPRGIGPRRR